MLIFARNVCALGAVILLISWVGGCSEQSQTDVLASSTEQQDGKLIENSSDLQSASPETTPGQELYVEHCAACHGYDGRGDGPIAKHLSTPPRGLAEEQWRLFTFQTTSEERAGLEEVIVGGLLEQGMPALSEQVTNEQVELIINHVLEMRSNAGDQ